MLQYFISTNSKVASDQIVADDAQGDRAFVVDDPVSFSEYQPLEIFDDGTGLGPNLPDQEAQGTGPGYEIFDTFTAVDVGAIGYVAGDTATLDDTNVTIDVEGDDFAGFDDSNSLVTAAAISGSEVAALAEIATVLVSVASSDTVTAADNGGFSLGLSAAEAATATEAIADRTLTTQTDFFAFSETTENVAVGLAVGAETATAFDAGSVTATAAASDFFVSVDTALATVSYKIAETVSAGDIVLAWSGGSADYATGSDAGTSASAIVGTETSVVLDFAAQQASYSPTESISFTDTAAYEYFLFGLDFGFVADVSGALSAAYTEFWSFADVALPIDVLVTEIITAADLGQVPAPTTDSCVLTDSAVAGPTANDFFTLIDSASVDTAQISGVDTASALEVVSIAAILTVAGDFSFAVDTGAPTNTAAGVDVVSLADTGASGTSIRATDTINCADTGTILSTFIVTDSAALSNYGVGAPAGSSWLTVFGAGLGA